MKQKTGKIAAALLVITLIAVSAFALFGGDGKDAPLEGNLIANADFSSVANGLPSGWEKGMWITSSGASYLEAVTMDDGTTAVLVENAAANDARFEQTVSVRENATYKLTARVMAEGCDPDILGANVSFLGIYGTSNTVHDTQGQWETVTLYGQTGKGQKEVTVCARLGGYGAEATGKAWFTDMELTEVSDVPVGVSVLNLATPEPQKEDKKDEGETKSLTENAIPLLVCASVLYLLFAAAIVHFCLRPQAGAEKRSGGTLALCGILLLGLAVRMILAANVKGYGVDMGCFSAWAGKMASGGPMHFYEEGYFCDYPPAYMLVLGGLGLIADALHLAYGSMQMQMLLKFVPICCDLMLAALLYRAAAQHLGEKPALGMAALMALNPAFIVAGSCWGQIDAVLSALLVIMLLFAREGRWHIAIPVFALTVLAKPQAGLLAPLGVAALIKDVREKQNVRGMVYGIAGGLAVTLAVALPFSVNQQSAFWLVDKYTETLSSYNYATLSTGNLMFLLGGNWVAGDTVVFGPVTYGALGMALMIASFAFCIVVYMKGEGRGMLIPAAALTMQMVFVLGSKMHERYVLPALALMLLAYALTRDARMLVSALLVTAASAVNIGVVLAFEYLIAPNLWLGYIISVIQLIAMAVMIWACVDIAWRGHAIALPERSEETAQASEETVVYAADERMRRELLTAPKKPMQMTGRDWAIMLLLTAVYAVVGFWGLGDTTAPQTGYASTQEGESVVVDLGERREDFRLYYYGGISDTSFSVALSDDGEAWGGEHDAFFARGECFKWQALRTPVYKDGKVTGANGDMLTLSGRYIRLTFDGAASAIWEVAAVNETGAAYPVAGVSAYGAREGRGDDPVKLIDEQNTVPEKPTYMNSMYFDEIYHGRTGYEHANSLYTYETTHPPLGKVFMSWCIDLMGMTPFAWRFAGALTGVLMIPAMYLLAKLLLGRTLYAFMCAFLMSVDCMHFTQTRIATIDSFPVLFIMLMFLCMAWWMKMSFYHTKLYKTFIPLALSGAFMGLAISSKWIGCYSAVGLAVLFFSRFYSLWRQSVYAEAHRHEDVRFARAADLFPKAGLYTILACCVFFVAVPLVIYCLSYIPYLSAYGEVKLDMRTLERLIDAQIYMFEYHKDLVAEHYFASPWYEWPVIAKPMWYYSADFKGAGMASSILAFGNPAVWWTGLVGILSMLALSVWRNALPALRVIPGRDDAVDRAMPVIAVGFLSAYLPWVLISRLTFIYHYFASVPFIILATAQGLRYLERHRPKLTRALIAVLCIAALALFVAFYPLASGIEVPRAWCDAVSWFDNWMWY